MFQHHLQARAVWGLIGQHREATGIDSSIYDWFNFHLLRHTAGSLMALAGMDPVVAAERLGHSDGGALFLRTYRHL